MTRLGFATQVFHIIKVIILKKESHLFLIQIYSSSIDITLFWSQSFILVITVFQRKKILTSASQSQNKIAKILYSRLWSGAERTENYLVSRCTRENYRSLWWQWGKKLPHSPRDAYIFHSVEKTARLVLHQRYNSSWGEGTRATRCIAENATAWSLGIIYNFERRGQRENIKACSITRLSFI